MARMDDHSFELLMNKLVGLEAGQIRIEASFAKRFDEHAITLGKQDERLRELSKEVTFAKGVTYAINVMTATVAGFVGWNK
jgi:hypothetical protein